MPYIMNDRESRSGLVSATTEIAPKRSAHKSWSLSAWLTAPGLGDGGRLRRDRVSSAAVSHDRLRQLDESILSLP
jgi:hypothetical protein